MAERLGKYMVVTLVAEPRPDRKTSVWEILNTNSSARLGLVRWYGRWRQYTFEPSPETVFNRDCMIDLSNFLRRVNDEHRAKRTEARQ